MIAGWIEVVVTPPPGVSLGITVDGSNNAIQTVVPGSICEAAGLLAADLIVQIDDVPVTEFQGYPGPVEGTVVVTSEPTSIMGAHAAVKPELSSHVFLLLRAVDPDSIKPEPGPPAASYQQAPDVPHYLKVTPADPSTASSIDHTANPLEHYPWATAISVPDATFGASGDAFKTKYNLPPGTVLQPMQHVTASQASKQRKEIFKNLGSFKAPSL